MKKVVLAYSGGLDTSVCIPILKENYGFDKVVTVTVDVGQPAEEIETAKKFIGDESSSGLIAAVATTPAEPEKTDKEAREAARTARKAFTKELTKPLNEWERYAQVLLLTNELIYVN